MMRVTVITRSGERLTCIGDLARILESLHESPRFLKVKR